MHKILCEIESIIHKSITEVLPDLSFDDLEDNGTVFYMNGKNGTEFDWYVNEKLPSFMVFYNDETNLGAAQAYIYDDGGIVLYIYDQHGNNLAKEIKTYVDATEEEVLCLATILRLNSDEKMIFDKAIGDIDTDECPTEQEITEYKEHKKYYEEMIQRKAIMGKYAVVSKRITEDGYRVGYMRRDEPRNEEDSGWSFWAGDEDDEYSNNADNVNLYMVGSIINMDSALMKYIDRPAEISMIRVSDHEFIEDNGQDIVLGKWKETS
ncbi:DUF2185 domain-containing protein [Butyrivibrio sp. XB500-5]|uniref:immunity protein Imm33 domain-containing protein n=1 Tax=Butyrivibrio sp. XB500-5 TaxID=2364880 RepID=UPI000EA8BF5A|nr:DUF2185 domain-containing protein [Butyrivibrio sp. XB500-5]RKM63048.1 DUF2185 domain-containing protein [Butyrivibrio sp. XB500-5]